MGNGEPLITVVVVMYNARSCIASCLDSLKAQDNQNFALLVVDDGSTDGGGAVCTQLLAGFTQARYVSLAHGGVAQARNYGLSQVTTQYVMFVDGDDRLEPRTISSLYRILLEKRPDIVVFGFFYEMSNGDMYRVAARSNADIDSRSEMLSRFTWLWGSDLMYSVCNKLFRLEMIQANAIRFDDMDFGEDFKFCRDVMRTYPTLSVVEECFYHYTCHVKDSLSTSYRPDLFEIRVWEHCQMCAYFQDMGCMDEQAEEFLARRHIERVIGCVENECSPQSGKTLAQKWRRLKEILEEEHTQPCAKKARLTSLKMKILVFPLKRKWCLMTFLFGHIMTFCRNRLPRLFVWLKMNR